MISIFETNTLSWWVVSALYLIDLCIRLWLLVHIPRGRKPTAAMAWLLSIFIIPIFGTIFFFFIGNTKLSRKRRRDQQQVTKFLKEYNTNLRKAKLNATVNKTYAGAAQLAESLTGLAPTRGNEVDIISGYDNIINDMSMSIDTAKQYVYVEFFAMTLDESTEPFFSALERAVQRGVAVYVLFDYIGSRKYPGFRNMKQRLTDMKASWRPILPISLRPSQYNRPDLRNHRKILVIDNTDAYIGSLNMIDKTYHRKDDLTYIELVAHLRGPSVNELAAVFAGDWYSETGAIIAHFMENSIISTTGKQDIQILPSGPDHPHENNLKHLVTLIHNAKRSIYITNPYLVPDESLLNALVSASLRGVHVSILNSEVMDQWMVGHAQRSYYEQLLRVGVSISLYKKPQLVHEKYTSIDDEVAIIGSSNLDRRSFELNHECTAVVYDTETAKALVRHHKDFLSNSRRIILADWMKRNTWQVFLDSMARLSSALQ